MHLAGIAEGIHLLLLKRIGEARTFTAAAPVAFALSRAATISVDLAI